MIMMRTLIATGACALGTLAPAAATAQSVPDDQWRFQAILYGYFPTVGGSTTFPHGNGADVSVDANTLLKNLQGVFMGMFEASRGGWGTYTDIMYMDIGNSKSQTRDISVGGSQIPVDAAASLDFNLKGWVWTIAGTYQAVASPQGSLQVLAGARLLDAKQTLNFQLQGNIGSIPLPGRQGNLEAKLSNWDGIVGVKGRLVLGDEREWFVPYYVDVGTGQSDLTWQGIGGLGYSFHWGDIVAAWRYLGYNMKSGSKIDTLNFNGPAVGVAFRW
jgi:hypothetical protein